MTSKKAWLLLGLLTAAGSICGLGILNTCASSAIVFAVQGIVQIVVVAIISVLAFRERTSASWYGTIVLGVLAVTLANWDVAAGRRVSPGPRTCYNGDGSGGTVDRARPAVSAVRRSESNGSLGMRRLFRIAIILLAAAATAIAANALRPKGDRLARPSRCDLPATNTRAAPPPPSVATRWSRAIQQGVAIVDARKADLFEEGHIPGAIDIPADDPLPYLENLTIRSLPEDLVIVYCGGEPCDDSKIVFDLLKANGFTNIRLYFGGWRDWTEAGLDVEK